MAGIFSVGITPNTAPLSVAQFYATPPATPGNVGVSLSGGGSRALVAGMGQLRALNQLTANGRSLLAQVKALSTSPGGRGSACRSSTCHRDRPATLPISDRGSQTRAR